MKLYTASSKDFLSVNPSSDSKNRYINSRKLVRLEMKKKKKQHIVGYAVSIRFLVDMYFNRFVNALGNIPLLGDL